MAPRNLAAGFVLLVALCAPARAATWTAATSLPDAYDGHALVYASGRLYQTGGISYNGGIVAAVKTWSATAAASGAVGAWTPATPLPEAVYYHASVAAGGFVYVLGGYHYTDALGMVVSDAVLYSRVEADGALGPWKTTTRLPRAAFFPSAAAWNGRIYAVGGCDGAALSNAVYSAPVQADGSLGPWSAQAPLPDAVYTHASVSNGTLYVLGGTVHGGSDIQNAVYFSRINADGSLAGWRSGAPLPRPVANHGAAVANGRVFVTGGWTGLAPTGEVESAAVDSDGRLGAWSAEPPLPRPLYLHAMAVSETSLFVTGGIDVAAMRGEVYTLPLPAPLAPADTLPPRTTLAFGTPAQGPIPFVSPATPATLSAVDDALVVGDGAGVGVASTQWAVDDDTPAVYAAPIRIRTDGAHWIRFFSVDALGHAETRRSAAAAVDGTPPVSSAVAGAPQAVLASGKLVVGPDTRIGVTAADPVVNGVASGVARVSVAVDGGATAPFRTAFVLPAADGAHAVRTSAADLLGNAETPHDATIYRDGTAPATTLSFAPAPYAGPSGPVLNSSGSLSFTAVDPVSGGVAAGVHHTEYALDGASTRAYAGPFAAAEGAHALSYRSVDNVGNAETARSASFSVDATPPQSVLSVDGGTSLFGTDLITADSAVSLSASDPVSAGVASGVNRIVYSVDGGADQVYAAPFRLGAGRHVVRYGAFDNAGNEETRNSAVLSVDSFLSDALAATGRIGLAGTAGVVGGVRTNDAFTGAGRSFVDGDVAGLSVTLKDKSRVSGAITRGRATLVPPSYDLAAARAWARAHNDNASLPARLMKNGALILDERDGAVLPAGDYYLTGLRLRGRSSLTVSGRVNLFLDGALTVHGGSSLNAAGDAASLWIVSAYDGRDAYEAAGRHDEDEEDGDNNDNDDEEDRRPRDYAAFLTGRARAAFNLYAPLGDVRVKGRGQFAGRILARTVSLSGRALQPSTTVLPPPRHEPAPVVHRQTLVAHGESGTAGNGRVDDRDEAVVSSVLSAAPAPSAPAAAAPVAPGEFADAPAPVPLAAAVEPRRTPSKMPALSLSARAAFSMVGERGNAVRAKDRSGVVIPDGAASAAIAVTVAPPRTGETLEIKRRADAESRKGLVAAATGVQYGPEGTRFAKPVTLELPYDRASLPAGVAENALSVHYWNPATGDWEKLESSVDTVNQVVRAQTSHFSLYQLFGGGAASAAPSGADDPSFAVHAAYAFPNPSRGGAPVVFRVQPGLADSASVRVYDLSGRLVHDSSGFVNRGSFDDGNGFGSQFTFEHSWDVSGVASGVYTFVVTGRKAGAGDVHASGKVGVIK